MYAISHGLPVNQFLIVFKRNNNTIKYTSFCKSLRSAKSYAPKPLSASDFTEIYDGDKLVARCLSFFFFF